MDEISNRVCSVIDSAELCRQTHPDREFVEEAIKASIRVNEYLHYLNTNHTLYNAVIKAEQEGNLLTDEAHRVAHYLSLDFERSGIHLSAEKVDRVNRLSIDISQLCRQFKISSMTRVLWICSQRHLYLEICTIFLSPSIVQHL
ncbi:probable mitochondrial intermediate peptidase, mitochondrial [Prunus persica]|uniref:probable mitochondrial intermediate peptidase, mitochondrial n=1 Tax=Prunus persica TaxID=3760 RepID=UPI0009AB6874|nr:probable mitochondrial intermediate peptidase, mitochondrial [Prunus persica]XP_020413458.1 probable mitochondrial intermediate peptidase, mitochondrial [Prunus persica]